MVAKKVRIYGKSAPFKGAPQRFEGAVAPNSPPGSATVIEMVSNRSFTLTTTNGKRSRFRLLKNGVPKESFLALLLINIHCISLSCQTPSPESTTYLSCMLLETGRQWKEY